MERATENALIAIEEARTYAPPVYKGGKPLIKEKVEAKEIHGKDGLGDTNFHPNKLKVEKGHAIQAILRIIQENPYEIELITLVPLTNIAYAYLLTPEIMRKLKSITLMVGNGIEGKGNIIEFAEFNALKNLDSNTVKFVLDISKEICDVCKEKGKKYWICRSISNNIFYSS